MLSDIYNERLLELAGNIPYQGRLARPDARATARSRLCGSTVTVDLIVRDGHVVEFAQEVRACTLGKAACAIMGLHIIGSTISELRAVRATVRSMLKENGQPPGDRWVDAAVLEPVREIKARHASTMLAFDAVVDALDQIEAKSRHTPNGV